MADQSRKRKPQLPEAEAREAKGEINRREMVQRLVGGASSGLIVSTLAGATPAAGQAKDGTAQAETSGKAAGENLPPAFLDPHQIETLAILAERLVPGSTKAEVAPFVDLLLSVDTTENQAKFLAALSAMDGESLRLYGSPFKNLTEARQIELLTIASQGAGGRASGSLDSSHSGANPSLPPGVLHEHFKNLKGWVSKAYYSSEVGMKELGWTGNYFYPTFPGCEKEGS